MAFPPVVRFQLTMALFPMLRIVQSYRFSPAQHIITQRIYQWKIVSLLPQFEQTLP
jgi:hypothetical protein